MAATLPPQLRFQPLLYGFPLPAAKVYFYAAGTSTPQPVYAADGVTPLANPLSLDSNGCADFRLGSGLSYKINLTTFNDIQLPGWPVDNIDASDKQLLASISLISLDLANTSNLAKGDALIGVKSPLNGSIERTQHGKNTDDVTIFDFIGSTDLEKLNTAISSILLGTGRGTIRIPSSADPSFSLPILSLGIGQSIVIIDERPYLTNVLTTLSITAATNTNPVVLTVGAHGLRVGSSYYLVISGCLGNTAPNGTNFGIVTSATEITLTVTGNGVYTGGGVITSLSVGFVSPGSGGIRYYGEARDAGGYSVTEIEIAGPQNPGLALHSMSNGLSTGYTNPNMATSLVTRHQGKTYWQLISDPLFNYTDCWSFQHVGNNSRQLLTMWGTGELSIGQSGSMDFNTPAYETMFRGNSCCFEAASGSIAIILRLKDNSKRKIITFDTALDEIRIANTLNNKNIVTLKDSGLLKTTGGVSGGYFTTAERNALTYAATDLGASVFDTTLGIPIWLKSIDPQVWVSSAGLPV